MAKLVVLYKPPKEKAAFDAYYRSTHIPLAKRVPGLESYEISNGPVMTPAGPADVHLVAELSFADIDALMAGLGSPQGQAAAADLANFADGGAELLIFDSKPA